MDGAVERVDWLTGGSRRDAATERIYAAAAALLDERGFEAVTVEDVAARAGCSRATLYRYVGGRDAILDGVITRAAAAVATEVSEAVASLNGSERIVEAILTSVRAVRANPALHTWFAGSRTRSVDDYLASSPRLGSIAAGLTGLAPTDAAAQWTVRVVLALLTWPMPDPAAERQLVERFVAPAFA
ncbi:TetR/AcrR family transcriptional regulator [Rhodococcus sp. NPDC059234]|uniref:TetR/AcrR family transcriptional regulator n=1 Tax=Rhodococcus sp. NPDC059234 TaxID=3346781 RepID=UPI0036735934